MSKTSNYQVTLEERGDFTRGLIEEAEGKQITPLEIGDMIFNSITNQADPFADEKYNEIIDSRIDDLQEAK